MQKWMKRAVEDLQLMEQRRLAADGLRLRAKRLEADMVSLTGAGSGKVPVKGGGNRQEQRLCTFLEKKAKLEREERGLRELAEHTEKCLQSLPARERLVLKTMYCKGLERGTAVQKLEQELYCSRSEVYRLRERALYKMGLMLGYI